MIIRTCVHDSCTKTFTPKRKGMRQIYCSSLCRVAAWQKANPPSAALTSQYNRTYYYKHKEACQTRALERYHQRCECGGQKASASDAMCSACGTMPSVAKILQS